MFGFERLSMGTMGRRCTIFVIIVIAVLLVDGPMLVVPFVGDDALRANVDGWLAVHHASLFDAFRSELVREDLVAGRFHPAFVALTLLEMHAFHQPFTLKLLQLLAVAVNVVTLALVVRELTGSAERALAAAAWAILTLQIRAVYDATNGDALHLQLTLEAALLSVGFLAMASRNGVWFRWIAYGASVVSFALAIALYELMLPTIVPLVLSCLTKFGTAKRALLALPFSIVAAVDIVALVLIRHTFPPAAGSFYAQTLDFAFVRAAACQLVSTFPFVYEVVDPQRVFHASGTYRFLAGAIALAASVRFVCWFTIVVTKRSTGRRTGRAMLRTAGLSFLLTGVIVAASPVYQQQISIGLPYAPVYFQGFGLALLVVAGPSYRIATSSLTSRALQAAYVLLFFVLFTSNIIVARDISSSADVRKTIVDGLSHGAANDVPSGSLVFLDRSYYWVNDNSTYDGDGTRGPLLWDSTYFYRLWSGRTWRTRRLSVERLEVGEEAFELRSGANDRSRGTLIVQKVRGRGARVPPAIVDATIFQRGRLENAPSTPTIASTFARADFRSVRSGTGWRVSTFEPHCDALPNDALIANAPSAARLVYGRGISEAEDDGAGRGYWAGPQAELRFVNDTSRRLVVTFHATLETIGRPRGVVVITTPFDRHSIDLTSNRRVLRLVLPVAAKSDIALRLTTNAPDVAIAGDTRDLRYRLVDSAFTDDAGCAAADVSTAPTPVARNTRRSREYDLRERPAR